MSVKVSTWVWHNDATSELGLAEMMVLLALADICDDDGNVLFANAEARAQDRLARKAHMSVATFRRVIRSLEEARLLEVGRESRLATNSYRIITTAQIERSTVSGPSAQSERSDRSPVSGRSSYRRTNEVNVPEFDRFWSIYPRHEAKKKAAEIFSKLVKSKVDPQLIIAGAERYRERTRETEMRFIAHPSTWLNQARWEDEAPAAAVPAREVEQDLPQVPVEHQRILWERNVPIEEYLDFRRDRVPGRFESWWAGIQKRPVVA